jgi:UMF1 family MFS transporter
MNFAKDKKLAVWSWAFLDWGNSAFSLTVMTAFFPLFFAKYWCHAPEMTPEKGTEYLAYANAAYAMIIAVLAPILGAVADQGKRKKRFLMLFTLLGAASTVLLPLVAEGHYFFAAGLFTVASLGFAGNNTFYDSLLTDVADASEFDRVSAFGFSIGYLGSELLFVVNSAMVMRPAWFGLADVSSAFKVSFVMTGIWWLVFSIPTMIWVKESGAKAEPEGQGSPLVRGFRQFWRTFQELKKYKIALTFLLAYIFYIDGINTIISMAVDYGAKIGVDTQTLIIALHVTQIVAIPATILYGRLGESWGSRKTIYLGILVYAAICFWAYFMKSGTEFVVMAGVIGGVQGGVQSLSRSYFARLIPEEKSGEFFGFYNMMGKFAAVLGPLLMGLTVSSWGQRGSILSLLVLFVIGAAILALVNEEAAA